MKLPAKRKLLATVTVVIAAAVAAMAGQALAGSTDDARLGEGARPADRAACPAIT